MNFSQRLSSALRGKFFIRSLVTIVLVSAVFIACDKWVALSVRKQIFSDINKLPEKCTGLVLGTSRLTKKGQLNPFFQTRMEAAAELFKSGKIHHIIVSGDNSIKEYDEAGDMRRALIELGVPDSCITSDFAGFRTLDSVVRCNEVFGQDEVIIISQKFHNERALFIANRKGLNAVAYNTEEVSFRQHPFTFLREYGARFKCVLDLYLLNTAPKFGGEKVPVPGC